MSEKIKSCPWCGSKCIGYQVKTADREGIPLNAICEDCAACSPWEYIEPRDDDNALQEAALRLWNNRDDSQH